MGDTFESEGASPDALAPPPLPNRRRWWFHLILLTAYPLSFAILGALASDVEKGPVLPETVAGLLRLSVVELGLFAFVFLVAWRVSGARTDELRLRWRGGFKPILRGLGYSIGLRIAVAVVAIAVILIGFAFVGVEESSIEKLRPKVDAMVSASALANDPLYLWLNLTLISFVVAGLREELWRVGMLAGLQALFPRQFSSRGGAMAAVALIAIVFGLGHTPQGWTGVLLTTCLGIGLGAIIVFHRSIWDAVFAHGFFDATTFALLYALTRWSPGIF